MFTRIKRNSCEANSGLLHKEYQNRETSVAEYYRKYGVGKLNADSMPRDTRPEVSDPRSVDEMLADGFEPSMGTDPVEVMQELARMRDKLRDAQLDVKATQSDKAKFDAAVKVLNDDNASYEATIDAHRIIDELEKKGKVTRARAT